MGDNGVKHYDRPGIEVARAYASAYQCSECGGRGGVREGRVKVEHYNCHIYQWLHANYPRIFVHRNAYGR